MNKNALALSVLLGSSLLGACSDKQEAAPAPVEVKVVVVTMFEIGNDDGDAAGEFQTWKTNQQLTQAYAFPQSHHDLYLNPETGVLGMVTGMGTNKSSSAIMALGLDPRFDLSKAYWLVAGISGFDPQDASIGSAAWAEWVVDGDLGHEIDAREIPDGWNNGYFPLFSSGPEPEKRPADNGEVFHLNAGLTDWAFQLTKDTELGDDPVVSAQRAAFTAYPNAQKPPFVLKGDTLSSMTFWHGNLLNDWANRWVSYWSEGQGEFVSSAMEDTGTAQSLRYLTRAGKADEQRLMVLRTASNFTIPDPGVTAADNLIHSGENYSGLGLAIDSAYRVGSVVVNEIVSHWDEYKTTVPGKP
ncbi:purine nucleoside permease [Thalassolituus sp. LLYu03]|uniref:purine nucleoside permease n=1 Tax=Thalassolituus sp. LLYu03 TaxID=3421656 RepID=UPI003D29C3E1